MTAIDCSEAVAKYLLTQTAITDLVGTRIYPDVLPEACTLPAIVYSEISDNDNYHLSGVCTAAECRVQIDCYGATRASANAVGRKVREIIGNGTSREMGGMQVLSCHSENGHTMQEQPVNGTDNWRYVRSRDFLIIYETKYT